MIFQKLMQLLGSFNEASYLVAREICAGFLAVVVLSVVGQVFSRYVLLSPLIWTEEASIFALSWVILLGTSLGVRKNTHLVCDFLPSNMPYLLRTGLAIFGYAMTGVMAIVFIWYGYQFSVLGLSRFSYSTGLPMVYLYAAMPISGVLTVLYLIEEFIGLWVEEDI